MQRKATIISPEIKLRLLAASLFLMVVIVEFLTRAIHDHRKVTLGIEDGVHQAIQLRQSAAERQILVAGNSLVFEDVSQPELQQGLGSGFVVHTAGVPGSTYDDWRYGLRSLFARGSQPDMLVFSISPSQFLRPPSVTPLLVSQLWSVGEIFDYARDQRLGLTKFSELLLEHYSTFFSLRDTVRIYVRKLIPGYEAMLNNWESSAPVAIIESQAATEAAFSTKLSDLTAACGSHTRLVLMIAPTNQPGDEAVEPALRTAAERLAIPVVEPVRETEWPLTDFQDDHYHLSPAAAARFSRLVAFRLRRLLADSSSRPEEMIADR